MAAWRITSVARWPRLLGTKRASDGRQFLCEDVGWINTEAICILLTSTLEWDDADIKRQACFK